MSKNAIIFGFVLPALAGAGLAFATMSTTENGRPDGIPPGGTADRRGVSALAKKVPDPRFKQRLESMTTHEFPALIAELQQLPQHQRGLAIELALTQWAHIDLDAALGFLNGDHGGELLPPKAHRAVYQLWAHTDIEAALASLDEDSLAVQFDATLIELSQSDPARAWKLMQKRGFWPSDEFISAVFSEWMHLDSDAAWKAAVSESEIRRTYFNLLAERNPEEIRTRVKTEEPRVGRLLLSIWARHDADAAHAFSRSLLEQPPFDTDPRFLSLFGSCADALSADQLQTVADSIRPRPEWSEQKILHVRQGIGLQLMKRIMEEVDGTQTEPAFLRHLASAYGQEDPMEGLKWLETLSGDRSDYRYSFYAGWRWREPMAAVEHLDRLPPSEALYRLAQERDSYFWDYLDIGSTALSWYDSADPDTQRRLIAEMPEKVMRHDPRDVLEWSVENSAGGELTDLAIEAFVGWFGEAEGNVTGWLNAADPALRDQLLSRLEFGSFAEYDSPFADVGDPGRWYFYGNQDITPFDLAARISDPVILQSTLRQLVTGGDEPSLQAALDHSEIPPAVRTEVQELIDAGLANVGD